MLVVLLEVELTFPFTVVVFAAFVALVVFVELTTPELFVVDGKLVEVSDILPEFTLFIDEADVVVVIVLF